jgi:predicted nucleic acid-binding Zn ribbon protein
MPARWSDRHRDGGVDEPPSKLPAADCRDLELARQDPHHDASVVGGGQSATVGLPRRGRRWPTRPPKSPALKLKIREQLRAKHARFLQARRRPEELVAYWAAQLDDDPTVAQRAFDEVDHRMRAANWDDMREWRREQGIA